MKAKDVCLKNLKMCTNISQFIAMIETLYVTTLNITYRMTNAQMKYYVQEMLMK